MESDESAHPKHVGLLRAEAVVAVADSLAHLVEQPGRSQRVRVLGFIGWLVPHLTHAAGVNFSAFRYLCALEPPGYLSPC
jgi:hypothetical protein